jgi:peptidylprolyl isomerase
MVNAQVGDVVKVNLDVRLNDGTVVISTSKTQPISFQIGAGKVIRGLEKAVVSMAQGQSKTTKLPPEEAFGRYSGKRLLVLNRSDLPHNISLKKGQFLKVKRVQGGRGLVRVAGVDESQVMLDTNHLLAGKEIILDIKLLEILPYADSSQEILEIGHATMDSST